MKTKWAYTFEDENNGVWTAYARDEEGNVVAHVSIVEAVDGSYYWMTPDQPGISDDRKCATYSDAVDALVRWRDAL